MIVKIGVSAVGNFGAFWVLFDGVLIFAKNNGILMQKSKMFE